MTYFNQKQQRLLIYRLLKLLFGVKCLKTNAECLPFFQYREILPLMLLKRFTKTLTDSIIFSLFSFRELEKTGLEVNSSMEIAVLV